LASVSCILSQDAGVIKDVISNSKKYLKIVTFRFDSKEFADLILEKAKNNVKIEIITTPSDNIAKDTLRPTIEAMYQELKSNKVTMHFCRWEAGEPRLTTTSMSGNQSAGIGEKWYSLHLQLLINENEVLVTSRPLTADRTIDIYYRNEEESIVKAGLSKFEEIKKEFLEDTRIDGLTIPGKITHFLDQKTIKETIDFFKLTKRLNVKQYEIAKLPKNPILAKGLLLSPFDGKMRDLLYSFIDSAETYIYFYLETLFDEDLIGKLQVKITSNPTIQIKIITCPPEKIRQNPQKARELITQALSFGVQIGNQPNIQAKFWVSNKWLAISSGDFNRMNLGHNTTSLYWKADTQLLLLENNQNLIVEMKNKFEKYFCPIDQGKVCSKDVITLVQRITKRNRLSASTDACKYLCRFKAALMIKTEQDVRYIMETAASLAKAEDKSRLEGRYMFMAIILYYLQRREHTLEEIIEKLQGIESESEIKKVLFRMEQIGQVVNVDGNYRIAPNLNYFEYKNQ
jgi:hypothetical protein